jgi:signal transduction histidine kinase
MEALMRSDVANQDTGTAPAHADDTACEYRRALERLKRDLHDSVGSVLSALVMQLELAERLTTQGPEEARHLLADVRSEVTTLIDVVRSLTAPTQSGDTADCGDPETAMRSMLGKVARMFDHIQLSTNVDPRLRESPREIASAAFAIVRESIINVLKHSRARHCAVQVLVRDHAVHVRVEDDGVGLTPSGTPGGSGLSNMTQRAGELGGWCAVRAVPTRGVRVVARIPFTDRGETGVTDARGPRGVD